VYYRIIATGTEFTRFEVRRQARDSGLQNSCCQRSGELRNIHACTGQRTGAPGVTSVCSMMASGIAADRNPSSDGMRLGSRFTDAAMIVA